ncbi:ATP-binding protein [Trichothermofontia sichuanensis B231]|uniref:ATP-binding protein n=1 Tax=Trichothermofontia sichuanensis TaxID=3045816 RepID=UPI00224826C4|nr:ATP-binding protein [Trichothermofontia sichuanensis]UZQ54570.1 ATP-binding protein [Trichothermofontia sichuanensis B231]
MNPEVSLADLPFDLSTCEEEPIHIPGSIQPHGLLVVLAEPSLEILQISGNTELFWGQSPASLIGQSISKLLNEPHMALLTQALGRADCQSANPLKFGLETQIEVTLDGVIHRNPDQILILELLPTTHPTAPTLADLSFFDFFHLVQTATHHLQNATDLEELCQVAAQEVQKITGFDRVMIYRFDEQKNGEVIVDEKREDLESWLHLHYPAADIPRRARSLYQRRWIRLIPDVNYQPAALFPVNYPLNNTPLDLSDAILRSVSPIHIEYLKNMGVRATLNISLLKAGDLWGLIACHHYSPRYIPYQLSLACEFLGQVMSMELAAKEAMADVDYRMFLKSLPGQFLEWMATEANFIDGLTQHQPTLLELVRAQGAAICFDDRITTIGETPTVAQIQQLRTWLGQQCPDGLFATHCLSDAYPDAAAFKETASGLLAIAISSPPHNYVLWFRPEVVRTVDWAGDPQHPVEVVPTGDTFRLSPRRSFARWQEIVERQAYPWKPCELEAALALRQEIIDIVLRQAAELAQLNARLQRSEAILRNKAQQLETALHELQQTQAQLVQTEKMSSLGQLVAGIAHEINNPINFIHGNLEHANQYTQDLLALVNHCLQKCGDDPDIQSYLEAIDWEFLCEDLPKLINSMQVGVDRIQKIIISLRHFSRLDEAEKKPVDIHEGIDSTLMILQHRLKAKPEHPAIQVIKAYGDLPLVECYAGQLNQVFMNVLSNAIDALEEAVDRGKWPRDLAESASGPQIRVVTETTDDDAIHIRIQDNGTGIPPEDQARLFDPFFTSKPIGKGTGLGLAISYQIVVDRHGGSLTCQSQLHEGTEFTIKIPIHPTVLKDEHLDWSI